MKLLVTGAARWSDKQLETLEKLGNEIVFVQDERVSLVEQQIVPSDIEGVVCNGLFLYNDIDAFLKLKFVQLTSAGYDRVPMDYISAHNISIFNASGVYSIPMAEFAVCGVLDLYKQMNFFRHNQSFCKWEKHRGLTELYGKKVCIVGCGSVGGECAKRFSAFGCDVIGVDVAEHDVDGFDSVFKPSELKNVLPISDIVILCLPLSDETRHLFDEDMFAKVKCGAVLVNISRGAVVDTEAMIDALENKRLSGAVLDVFEEEPLKSDSKLWGLENVIITPHNAFVGENNNDRLFKVVSKNIKSFLEK